MKATSALMAALALGMVLTAIWAPGFALRAGLSAFVLTLVAVVLYGLAHTPDSTTNERHTDV